MTNMTPSTEPITEGQISKLNQNVTARLLKRKNELPSNIFQQVLRDETLLDDVYAAIIKRIDAISNMIVLTVKVDRTRSAKEALSATGRTQYTTDSVVKAMPNGTDEEVEVCFFKIGHYISMTDLEKEYELRGLDPVDPYSLAAVNEADPAFADEKPNGTQWKDAKGNWCYATFYRFGVGRNLSVPQHGNDWGGRWFFAGVRKKVLVS